MRLSVVVRMGCDAALTDSASTCECVVHTALGKRCLHTALADQLDQMASRHRTRFAADIHLVLATRAFAIGQVIRRGQTPSAVFAQTVGHVLGWSSRLWNTTLNTTTESFFMCGFQS